MGLFSEDYGSVVQVSSYAAKNKNERKKIKKWKQKD